MTFPLFVYGAARVGLPPQVQCFGTLLFVVGLIVVWANGALNRHDFARAATEDSLVTSAPLEPVATA